MKINVEHENKTQNKEWNQPKRIRQTKNLLQTNVEHENRTMEKHLDF